MSHEPARVKNAIFHVKMQRFVKSAFQMKAPGEYPQIHIQVAFQIGISRNPDILMKI